MTRQGLLVLGLCAAALPAAAQDFNRPDIVRGLCQKDGCAEFVVRSQTPFAKGRDGDLIKTEIDLFHASSQGRTGQGTESGFVYCSKTRPAVISGAAGQPPVAFMLAPDEQTPSWVQRGSTNFYAIYFAVCHGLAAGRAAAKDRQGVARDLGYHVALERSQNVTLGKVEDILTPR